jgi:hypothetical protein
MSSWSKTWVLAVRQKGSLSTYAVPHQMEDGVMVDVWESQEAFERFANELLIPHARAVGFPQPSKREFFEPFHVLTSWPSSNPLCLCYPLGAAVDSIHRAAESIYSRKFACSRSHRYTEVGARPIPRSCRSLRATLRSELVHRRAGGTSIPPTALRTTGSNRRFLNGC